MKSFHRDLNKIVTGQNYMDCNTIILIIYIEVRLKTEENILLLSCADFKFMPKNVTMQDFVCTACNRDLAN